MNANEPAFPRHYGTMTDCEKKAANRENLWTPGLTKREYFAAMAMQGLLSNPITKELVEDCFGLEVPRRVAELALHAADALLAELERSEK